MMAEAEDGTPVVACCPPGYHDRADNRCATLVGTAYSFTPKPRMWFTQNFIAAVWIMGRFPSWSIELRDDGQPLMKYSGADLHYVWRLTDVYGGPQNFWREGRWPD